MIDTSIKERMVACYSSIGHLFLIPTGENMVESLPILGISFTSLLTTEATQLIT